jgi:hypothetical protein
VIDAGEGAGESHIAFLTTGCRGKKDPVEKKKKKIRSIFFLSALLSNLVTEDAYQLPITTIHSTLGAPLPLHRAS